MLSGPPIKLVKQEHKYGCVPACLAMILGWDYSKALAEFHNDFTERGTTSKYAKEIICGHGYSVVEKHSSSFRDHSQHNRRMLEPFAPIHLVTLQEYVDCPDNTHAVVMDAEGKLYDPQGTETRIHKVLYVMGFFRDV